MNDKILSIIIRAQDDASRVISEVSEKAAVASDRAAAAIGRYAKAGSLIAGAGIITGIGLATKASWDQVNAVQQATVALSAYEKSGTKVDAVLRGLLTYARSDMGVLFNRTDLFAAAQSLKTMGDNTDQLTEHVKIMSRSVGLGLSSWDELSLIVGRVGSTGRLAGDDFDNLTKAGYKLDPALRNTNVTFQSLFAALNKGIPADAMAGQAETIRGAGIRMETAFRNMGNAVLGVDSDTNQFIKGGLGDRLTNGVTTATTVMRNLTPAISAVSGAILSLSDWLGQHRIVLSTVAGIIAAIVVPAFLSWAWASTVAAASTLLAMAPVIALGAVVGVLAYLIVTHWDTIKNTFLSGVRWIGDRAIDIGNWFAALPGRIGSALTGLGSAIIAPFLGAYEFIRTLPDKMVGLFSNLGGSIRNVLGNIDIPGPLGRVRDVIPGWASGGFTGRGAANEVAGFVHKGEYVIPKSGVDQSTGQPLSAAGSAVNIYGSINLGSADAVDRFFTRLDTQKEMGALGVGV